MAVHDSTSVVMGEGQGLFEEAMGLCLSLKKGLLYEIPNSSSALRRCMNKSLIPFGFPRFC
jgi:hypothetical protein